MLSNYVLFDILLTFFRNLELLLVPVILKQGGFPCQELHEIDPSGYPRAKHLVDRNTIARATYTLQ